MANKISGPVGAWEDPKVANMGGNKSDDVKLIQKLLAAASKKTGKAAFNPGEPDGRIARAPKKSVTLEALYHFQKQFTANPDRRVDVGGNTWKELAKYAEGATAGGLTTAIGPPQLITHKGNRVPFFTQFDSKWGSRTLGNNKSLAKAGCAISSIAMILKYYERDMDPGKLDEYLDDNDGYDSDNVKWSVAFKAGEETGKPKLTLSNFKFTDSTQFDATISQRLAKNWPTLAHLDYGSDANVTGDHWVVIVGKNANGNSIINDPGTSEGDGASNPYKTVTTIGESTRKGGLTIVRLCLFDVN